MSDDKKKGVGTLPVRVGETAARYINIASILLAYLVIIYLVFFPRYFTPVMLIVVFASKRALLAIGVLSKPRPDEPPEDFEAWPTWYSAFNFYHNRLFGGLLILGLIVDVILRIYLTEFWPLL